MKPIMDWRVLKVGDKVAMSYDDFDGASALSGTVTTVSDDHAIAVMDGMRMWIDSDTVDQFYM